jgi:ABC-type phosphate transport system permease subunit
VDYLGNYWNSPTMIDHVLLSWAVAAFMVINLIGAAFSIARVYSRRNHRAGIYQGDERFLPQRSISLGGNLLDEVKRWPMYGKGPQVILAGNSVMAVVGAAAATVAFGSFVGYFLRDGELTNMLHSFYEFAIDIAKVLP